MRILHILKHTKRLNGNVHAAVDLACAQATLGHTVAICSGGGDFDALLRENSVQPIELRHETRASSALQGAYAVGRLARSWRADILHAHMMTSAALAWPSCKLTGTPLITTVHNEFQKSAVLMGLGSRVIVVSAAVGRSMRKRGLSASKLRVVLNGTIGAARLAIPSTARLLRGEIRILFVGGLQPRKGVGDLLDAFKIVRSTLPNVHLHIVGEGPHQTQYQEQVVALGLTEDVTFWGATTDPKSFLLGADIFVLPSHADPAPLVLSEAREAGCAVIASDVDGIPELVENGAAGRLVRPKDVPALASAISAIASDPLELAHWRQKSQINIDALKVERVANDTLKVYHECLNPSGRHARPQFPAVL